MVCKNEKYDPIHDEYYIPLKRAEKISGWFFHISAWLSIATLFIGKSKEFYSFIEVLLIFSVVIYFVLNVSIRNYFLPRAEQKRQQDFLYTAYGTSLASEQTKHYYNNEISLTEPIKKIALQLLENCLFSKEIARRMLWRVRAFTLTIYWDMVSTCFSKRNRLKLDCRSDSDYFL
jgi:hypothetical protein